MIWEMYETKLRTSNLASSGKICETIPLLAKVFCEGGESRAADCGGMSGLMSLESVSSKDNGEDLVIERRVRGDTLWLSRNTWREKHTRSVLFSNPTRKIKAKRSDQIPPAKCRSAIRERATFINNPNGHQVPSGPSIRHSAGFEHPG